MAEIPAEIKPIFDEFTTVEGEILAEVGVSIETIIEYAREWEQRCMPQFLSLFAAGVQAGREAAAADAREAVLKNVRPSPYGYSDADVRGLAAAIARAVARGDNQEESDG